MTPPRELTLQFLAEPADVNFGGKVHGGMVMKWIDQAGYACAAGWCSGYAVTVYVGGIRFLRPIQIGQLVEVQAQVIHTGTTSMHLAVDVYSRHPTDPERRKTTHCIIIFVAAGERERSAVAALRQKADGPARGARQGDAPAPVTGGACVPGHRGYNGAFAIPWENTMSLETAPAEVQLAVDLIELLETNKIAPELALAALAIVRQDYERKLREGREL